MTTNCFRTPKTHVFSLRVISRDDSFFILLGLLKQIVDDGILQRFVKLGFDVDPGLLFGEQNGFA